MATYTENYNLKKPTYAEPANVMVINENMDKVDDIMHSSQVSLADAYDLNSTYNTGDKVMYEMLMYKCKEDGVTGAWDASKWERTTAVEGSGGADLDIYGEASGTAEASFSDGAEASLVECEIGIVPTQDLHGYSKPWAGGAGKNKCPTVITDIKTANTTGTWSGNVYDINNGHISILTDSDGNFIGIKADGTFNNTTVFYINNYGKWLNTTDQYILNGLTGGGATTYKLDVTTSNNPLVTCTDGDSSILTVDNSQDYRCRFVVYSGTTLDNLEIIPMIRISSQTDSYEPYSNICPISGHTNITVTVASTSGGSGEDTTVALGRTVYSGTLDVTKGILTVDRLIENINSFSGGVLPQTNPAIVVKTGAKPSDNAVASPLLKANEVETYSANYQYANAVTGIAINNSGQIRLSVVGLTTTEEYNTWLSNNPLQFIYPLATPQTFTLTKKQIFTLLGQNYVSHDGGGTISLVYIKKDSTIIPNPTGADIPLTGIEIDGEKFKIAGGNSEIIPIPAGDDTTSRTFTFSKTPKFIKFYWDDTVIEGTGWVLDSQLVWGQPFINYLAHARYTAISGGSGASAAISYGADGKSITITGGNAFGAMNTSNGTGLMFVEY